jgi:trk system potassium uptake protein TrkA
MDITDIHALKTLPLKDSDMVIVALGHDFGTSVKTTALLKKLGVQRLYSRESSLIHKTVLNALGVSNTINPEYDTAIVFAEKLIMTGVWSIYNISDELKIAEVSVPEEFYGKNFRLISSKELQNLKILAIKKPDSQQTTPSLEKCATIEIEDPNTTDIILEKDMRFVLKGRKKDIVNFLKL